MAVSVTDYNDPRGEIVTFTGRVFAPLEPDASKVNIVDIAHSLANSCRFTGHVRTFYSVAEHSVRVAQMLPQKHKLWGLLHDATEAYLADVARPVKLTPRFGRMYKEYEERLLIAVAEAFGLSFPEPAAVKAVDRVLLAAEQRDLMPRHRRVDPDADEYPQVIVPWTPEVAKAEFLTAYESITGLPARR